MHRRVVDTGTGMVLAASYLSDVLVNFAGAGALTAQEESAFEDLRGGPNTRRVLSQTGWTFKGEFVRVNALTPDGHVAASGWAGAVRLRIGGESLGMNVSCGVHPRFRGRGLGALLSALAVSECLVYRAGVCDAEQPQFVNIQTRADNAASRALCRRLGMHEIPAAAFLVSMPGGDPIRYVGYREPTEQFWHRVMPVARVRVPDYRLGDLAPLGAWKCQMPQQPDLRENEAVLDSAEDSPRG
jgi:GNAT superfamily N-acetyltransferase